MCTCRCPCVSVPTRVVKPVVNLPSSRRVRKLYTSIHPITSESPPSNQPFIHPSIHPKFQKYHTMWYCIINNMHLYTLPGTPSIWYDFDPERELLLYPILL